MWGQCSKIGQLNNAVTVLRHRHDFVGFIPLTLSIQSSDINDALLTHFNMR